jgi:hypothetical protein
MPCTPHNNVPSAKRSRKGPFRGISADSPDGAPRSPGTSQGKSSSVGEDPWGEIQRDNQAEYNVMSDVPRKIGRESRSKSLVASGSQISFSSLLAGTCFFGRLPVYLHRRLTTSEIRTLVTIRLKERDERFLERMREDVYGRPASVYAELLRHVRCEYGDIEADVRAKGLEAALTRLFRAGVYLTVDEFKGRKTVVRGSLEIQTDPRHLRSPRAAYHLPGSSGGSRSLGTPVLFDLRSIRDCASNCALNLCSRGGAEWIKCDWETPGAGARFRLMKFAAFGDPPQAWFSQMHPDDPLLPVTTGWNTRAIRLAGALVGRSFPAPVYAPLSDPTPVARWVADVLRHGQTPLIHTFPSSAVRMCLAAKERGIDVAGTQLLLAGEPVTEACARTVRAVGSEPIPRYGSMETGAIGYGCLSGEHSDEVHLVRDMHALIQPGAEGRAAALPENALLTTALHPRSPFLMLNVSMGDQAVLTERDCGCPLKELGWTPQLHSIRSFEKLSTLGATFLGDQLIAILERTLPARLGGAPTSYQLVEEETADGQPRLQLRVDPSIEALDDSRIAEEFCSAVAAVSASHAQRIEMWRDANTLRVVRALPIVSRAGKILHIHRMAISQ